MLRFTSILTALAWVGLVALFVWPATEYGGHLPSSQVNFAITVALVACGVIALSVATLIRPSRIVVSLLLIISIIAECWAAVWLGGLVQMMMIFPLSGMTREAWVHLSEFFLLFVLPWLWAIACFRARHGLTQRLPAKIFAVAAGLIFVTAAWTVWRAWTARSIVLSAPIALETGAVVSRSFTVDRATSYELKIECEKNPELTQGPQKNRAATQDLEDALTDGLETEVTIATNGRSIRADWSSDPGHRHMSFSQASVARILCIFDAKPHRRYELNLRIVRAGPSEAQKNERTDETLSVPASAHPMLKIEIDPHNYESDMLTTLVLFFAGSVCLVIAISIFLLRVLRRKKSAV